MTGEDHGSDRPRHFTLSPNSAVILLDLGIHPADLTRMADLPEDLFSRGTIRLGPEEYSRLRRGLDELVGDPLLPIRMARVMGVARRLRTVGSAEKAT